MIWKLILGFIIFLALCAAGLALYGSFVAPPQQGVEQVLPDNRFPR